MGRRSLFWLLILISLFGGTASAVAASALTPPVPGGVVLAFGAAYESGGKHVTHRGLDLQGSAGDTVRAACDGEVTFAGAVPAEGGGRTLAVTIRSADGLLVCVSPLATTSVRKGTPVAAGDPLGELAQSGDGSWNDTHVHLSVRDGDTYIEPALSAAQVSEGDGGAPTVTSPPISEGSPSGGVGSTVGASTVGGSPGVVGAPSVSMPAPATIRGSVPRVDAARIRAAYSDSIGALRSSGRGQVARFFGEPGLADMIERPSTVVAHPGTAPVNAVLAVLLGALGVGIVRQRTACAIERVSGGFK